MDLHELEELEGCMPLFREWSYRGYIIHHSNMESLVYSNKPWLIKNAFGTVECEVKGFGNKLKKSMRVIDSLCVS